MLLRLVSWKVYETAGTPGSSASSIFGRLSARFNLQGGLLFGYVASSLSHLVLHVFSCVGGLQSSQLTGWKQGSHLINYLANRLSTYTVKKLDRSYVNRQQSRNLSQSSCNIKRIGSQCSYQLTIMCIVSITEIVAITVILIMIWTWFHV